MDCSEGYSQLAQRCAQLAIACSAPTLSEALTRLASDYVAQSHRDRAADQQCRLQLNPLGFGD